MRHKYDMHLSVTVCSQNKQPLVISFLTFIHTLNKNNSCELKIGTENY